MTTFGTNLSSLFYSTINVFESLVDGAVPMVAGACNGLSRRILFRIVDGTAFHCSSGLDIYGSHQITLYGIVWASFFVRSRSCWRSEIDGGWCRFAICIAVLLRRVVAPCGFGASSLCWVHRNYGAQQRTASLSISLSLRSHLQTIRPPISLPPPRIFQSTYHHSTPHRNR